MPVQLLPTKAALQDAIDVVAEQLRKWLDAHHTEPLD